VSSPRQADRADIFRGGNLRHDGGCGLIESRLLLGGGERLAEGPVSQILTRERLEALYGAPVQMIVAKAGTAFISG
jgi:hypothetical protein